MIGLWLELYIGLVRALWAPVLFSAGMPMSRYDTEPARPKAEVSPLRRRPSLRVVK